MTARSRTAGTRRGEDRRAQLLDAAVRVIARVGARSMRVEDVAREAGVSTALIYYYFADRTELLTGAFRHASAQMLGQSEPEASGDGRSRATRYLLSELELDQGTTTMWAFWSELAAAAVFDESLRRPINEGYSGWADQVAALIRAGQSDASIDTRLDASLTADVLTALMDGLGSRCILGGLSNEEASRIASIAIEGVLGARPSGEVAEHNPR